MMIRTLTVLAALAVCLLTNRFCTADDGEDLFALAAGYYNQQRWDAAAEKMAELLASYPDHRRASEAAFYRGEALMQTGNYPQAVEQFKGLMQRWPQHVRASHASFRLGEAAYLLGDHPLSNEWLRRFIRDYTDDPLCEFALPYLGEIALAKEAWSQAQTDFELALQKWPTGSMSERCRFGLGRAFDGQGQWQEAQRFYRFVGFQGTTDLVDESLLNLAIIQYQLQADQDAETSLLRLIEVAPDSPMVARAWYLVGRARQRLGELDGAIEALQSGVERASEIDVEIAPALLYELALTLDEVGRTTESQPRWEQLLADYPQSSFAADAYRKRIELAYEQQQWDQVLQISQQAMDAQMGEELRAMITEFRGRALLQQQRYDEAATAFEQLVAGRSIGELSDAELTYAYLWGLSLVRDGSFREALPVLEQTRARIDQGPLAAGVLLALETAQAGAGRDESLVETAQDYVDRFPSGLEVARVRVDLCLALARLRRWDAADVALEHYIDSHPQHESLTPTLQRMADLAYQDEQFKLASKWFGRLVEREQLGEEEPVVFLAVAWSRAREGDAGESQHWFQRLVEEYPEHPLAAQASLERGRYLEAQGEYDEALQRYRFVIDRFPASDESNRAALAAGLLLVRRGGSERLTEAATLFESLLERTASQAQVDLACYQLAWIHKDLGKSDAAVETFARLVKEHPESVYRPDALYRLAEQSAQTMDFDTARQWIKVLREDHPEASLHEQATYLSAQIAARLQEWQTVIDEVERLQTSNPESELLAPLRFWKAESLYRLQRHTEASTLFTALCAEEQAEPQRWLPMALLRRAQLAAISEDWDSARELCEELTSNHQDFKQDYEVDYLLGRYWGAKGDYRKAREAYQRVVRSPRGSQTETAAMAEWMIGETYFHQEEFRHAVEAYHRVETLYAYPKWQAAALLQSGKCHERMNQYKHAITLYAQLLRQQPDSPYAEEASRRMSVARQRMEQ